MAGENYCGGWAGGESCTEIRAREVVAACDCVVCSSLRSSLPLTSLLNSKNPTTAFIHLSPTPSRRWLAWSLPPRDTQLLSPPSIPAKRCRTLLWRANRIAKRVRTRDEDYCCGYGGGASCTEVRARMVFVVASSSLCSSLCLTSPPSKGRAALR